MKSYEWDEKKAKANYQEHGVTFGEATEVFEDPFALYIQDPTEIQEERTWIIGFTT